MEKISILDCTLRDGGYCNQWEFGKKNISKIVNGLISSNIEIIECGFLTEKTEYFENRSKYTKMEQLKDLIPSMDTKQIFVVMINYGEYDIEKLPECKDSPVDGIRVAFHKSVRNEALDYCKKIKEKGYLIFVQPMVSMSYSEKEFLNLIESVNEISPYAFYIVDSFGAMKKKSLLKLFSMVKDNLAGEIAIGFHSHDNFKLANSNAQALIENQDGRELIIDVSVHGMGRGAGNLNAELFLEYLNDDLEEKKYAIKPLILIADEILGRFYKEKSWGYSLPNYLSAVHMIHPSYANYLSEKNTLTVDAMDDIFSLMDPVKAVEFDPNYIEQVYSDYMSRGSVNSARFDEVKSYLADKKVLLIAPGKTATDEKDKIVKFVNDNKPIVISVNHDYPYVSTDFIFVSNMRRFKELPDKVHKKAITTTNIVAEDTYMTVDYYALSNMSESVKDNAGLMAIQFVMSIAANIYLAGYDGYKCAAAENYETNDMVLVMNEHQIEKLNSGMAQVLDMYQNKINIRFLTPSRFQQEELYT